MSSGLLLGAMGNQLPPEQARELAALSTGAYGDMEGLARALYAMSKGATPMTAFQGNDQTLPTSEDMASVLGADTSSPSWEPLGWMAPDLAGPAGKAGKLLGAMAAGMGAVPTNVSKKLAESVGELIRRRPTPEDIPNKINFKETDTVDPKVPDRIGTTGQYRGAPKGVDSPQKLSGLRKRLKEMAIEGTPGRLWYDQSAETAGNLTGAPNKKHMYAASTAITSQGASVPANQTMGIKGYNQAIMQRPVETGRFPASQGPKIEMLYEGVPLEGGPKVTPFYEGLTVDERGGIRPTNDLWMARAFDYKRMNPKTGEEELWGEGLGRAQHRFMDREINNAVKKANKEKWGGHDDWTPERMQAAIWVSAKARHEGTDVKKASRDFSDELLSQQTDVRYETRPSTSLNHLTGISGSQGYNDSVNALLHDPEGRNLMAMQLGALNRPSVPIRGTYEGVESPATNVRMLTGREGDEMDPASNSLARALAASHGLLLGQDTVGMTNFSRADNAGRYNTARMGAVDDLTALDQATPWDMVPVQGDGYTDLLYIADPDKAGYDAAAFAKMARKIAKDQGLGKPQLARNSGELVGNTNWDDPGFKPSAYVKEFDKADLGPDALGRADRMLRDLGSSLNEFDANVEKLVPEAGQRDEILTTTRRLLSEGGLEAVRKAVAEGVLPVVALAALGVAATQDQSEQALVLN